MQHFSLVLIGLLKTVSFTRHKVIPTNRVRPSLIPIIAAYYKGREMPVKWRGSISNPRERKQLKFKMETTYFF